MQPIQDTLEMALPVQTLMRRLAANSVYQDAFAAAFPDGLTAANVARALATYLRTVRSGDSPLDQFLNGDSVALSPSA
jgi:cytochrome c peroxidase